MAKIIWLTFFVDMVYRYKKSSTKLQTWPNMGLIYNSSSQVVERLARM